MKEGRKKRGNGKEREGDGNRERGRDLAPRKKNSGAATATSTYCRAKLLTSILMLLLTLRQTYTLNRLSGFQNLRRKGGKFDHRPERPKVLLRH